MDQTWKQKLLPVFHKQGNIWLVIILTLVGFFLLNALLAASGHPLISSAFSRKPRVSLVDQNGKAYPKSLDLTSSDQTIQVGWQSSLATACYANAPFDDVTPWSRSNAIKFQPVTIGPFTDSETIISVACNGRYGSGFASLTVRQPVASTGFIFSSPKKGDIWVVGKTYTIQWADSSTTDCRRDTLCPPGNPPADILPDCVANQTCQLDSSNSSTKISSQPVYCTDNGSCNPIDPLPPGGPTITLNHPEPACLNDPVHRCLPAQHIPYTIHCDVQSAGSCTWTIPALFDPYFLGEVLITVAPNDGRPTFSSDAFTIIKASTLQGSGIEGVITIGPTCGGPISIDGCADKPYQTDMIVRTSDGIQIVKRFSSDANGQFRVSLNPGTYILASGTADRLPAFGEQVITVKAGAYLHLDLMFDSGLR